MPSVKSRNYLYAFGFLLTFSLGAIFTNFIVGVIAHGGSAGLVHACYNARGLVVIIGASESCGVNETAIDWIKEEKRPFTCTSCDPRAADNLAGQNLSDSYITGSGFDNADLSSVNFTDSVLQGGSFSDTNFSSSNLTDVDFSGNVSTDTNFTNANLTNVDFTDTDLTGSTFTGTTRTGVEWNNTTCPDGTNSNSNSGTCEGHL